MLLIKAISVAMVTLIVSMLLKKQNPQIAAAAAASGGILLFLLVWEPLKQILSELGNLGEKTSLDSGYMALIMKVIMMTITCDMAVSLCREAGENGLGQKVEMVSHILLMSMAMPVLLAVVEMLRQWAVL